MNTIQNIYNLFKQHRKISTDSRKITKNCLFFALKGENFNGNLFAKNALENGASYAIIDEKESYISEKTILVENVLKSLQQLARIHRDTLKIPILGITGTNGKTTTKELTASVLAQKFKVSFTQGNLNNHIGVPLTLLGLDEKTEFGVIEMGANHIGEIAELCNIANPDFGLITNVGKAHLEGFGSFEGVKKTKSELYRFLAQKNGTIFINSDNHHLVKLAQKNQNKISYGTKNADFKGEIVQSPPFVHVKTVFPKGVLYLNSNLIGNFNFENILAAACVGNFFKVDPLKIQYAIKNYYPRNIRSQLIKKGDLNIVMDAYNANPTSMKESVTSFLQSYPQNNILILGDMLELGEYAEKEHQKIIDLIKKQKATNIFLVGKIFLSLGEKAKILSFENVEKLSDYLSVNKIKNGNLLIKGSRGIRLEKILDIF